MRPLIGDSPDSLSNVSRRRLIIRGEKQSSGDGLFTGIARIEGRTVKQKSKPPNSRANIGQDWLWFRRARKMNDILQYGARTNSPSPGLHTLNKRESRIAPAPAPVTMCDGITVE